MNLIKRCASVPSAAISKRHRGTVPDWQQVRQLWVAQQLLPAKKAEVEALALGSAGG